jgi:hypothetical protein
VSIGNRNKAREGRAEGWRGVSIGNRNKARERRAGWGGGVNREQKESKGLREGWMRVAVIARNRTGKHGTLLIQYLGVVCVGEGANHDHVFVDGHHAPLGPRRPEHRSLEVVLKLPVEE